ncbi:MAG TPA: DUF4126 domain-containing protein [Thermoanaerobaculia bacterium]|nr:DUF4126 domain-containing protein [Thermoanaerobaculia bacterium]
MPLDLPQIGLVAGTAVASGLRLYGTVAGLGFLHRIGALQLPGRLEVLAQTPVLVLATALYVVEFVADKVPIVDTVWDAVHTFIRVPAAAVLGFAVLNDVAEPWRTVAALLSGTVALSAHGLKAGTRLTLNASPEPFTNWAASFSEDLLLGFLLFVVVKHPVVAIVAAVLTVVIALLFASWVVRGIRRRFRFRPQDAGLPAP